MTKHITGLSAVCLLVLFKDCLAFQCYSCSYTRSSDPRLSYGCITEPWNVTTGMTRMECQTPYMCITKALFNQDMTHIRSVSRVCQPQQEVCQGESCCNTNGVYPTCEHKCRTDLCNKRNPETWLKQPESDVTDDNGRGGAVRVFSSLAIVIGTTIFCNGLKKFT